MLITTINVNTSCPEFHELIKSNNRLLRSIHYSQKYNRKRREEAGAAAKCASRDNLKGFYEGDLDFYIVSRLWIPRRPHKVTHLTLLKSSDSRQISKSADCNVGDEVSSVPTCHAPSRAADDERR
ncbi:hypothetical protein RF11_02243 [Thelohanellus kitauei]|uniref:Uncharacterized protein n=1 Tax=Thelohanellus kitauei TaxID=669202 RepID=A0A0C2MGE2_THEKT|nr:hypothetical protein RF11_02243 [Thelohanellus kitauei]